MRRSRRDLHDWVNLYGMIVLTAAGVVVAGVALWFQRTQSSKSASEEARFRGSEIQHRYESLRDSRAVQQGQFAAPLIRYVIAGSEEERRNALKALVNGASNTVRVLADVALARATTDDEREYIQSIRTEASDHELMEEFRDYLALAREFGSLDLGDQACSAYLQAWNRLPATVQAQIDFSRAAAGLDACTSVEPRARLRGIEGFRAAFAKVQTQ